MLHRTSRSCHPWTVLLQGREVAIMESLQRYVADEYKDKLQQEVDTSSWPIRWDPAAWSLHGRDQQQA